MSETEAIYDFTQKTRSGVLVWNKHSDTFPEYSNSRVTEAYTTTYNDETLNLSVESRVDTEYDTDFHKTIIHLWILDDNKTPLWRFPDNNALGDLLDTVRYQTGKVADRINRLRKGG